MFTGWLWLWLLVHWGTIVMVAAAGSAADGGTESSKAADGGDTCRAACCCWYLFFARIFFLRRAMLFAGGCTKLTRNRVSMVVLCPSSIQCVRHPIVVVLKFRKGLMKPNMWSALSSRNSSAGCHWLKMIGKTIYIDCCNYCDHGGKVWEAGLSQLRVIVQYRVSSSYQVDAPLQGYLEPFCTGWSSLP